MTAKFNDFLKERSWMETTTALLQYPKALFYKSSISACKMFHTTVLTTTDTSSKIGSLGSYGPSGRVACVADGLFAETYSWSHLKLALFQDTP